MDAASTGRAIPQRRRLRSVTCILIAAIVLITAALVLYSAGVWAERHAGVLRPGHAALFAAGFVSDAAGTLLMTQIARSDTYETVGAALVLSVVMAVTGAAALVLMGVHLTWAVLLLRKGTDPAKRVFHRFSVAVWGVWLIPYFTGMASAMVS